MTNESSNQISLTDQELQRRSQCALYVPTELDPLQGPAERSIRWALKERHGGKIHSAGELREYFTSEWMKDWKQPDKTAEYWEGPKNAAGFARRVYFFLLKHEVIHPFEPYTLQLDRGQVTGENAVVLWRKYRHEPVPMVVDPILRRPRRTLVPNHPVLAQWLAAREDADTVDLGIVHLPLVSGDFWTTKDVKEPLARRWINAIVNEAADRADFPRAGTQCKTCSQPCTEVFQGPDGPAWD